MNRVSGLVPPARSVRGLHPLIMFSVLFPRSLRLVPSRMLYWVCRSGFPSRSLWLRFSRLDSLGDYSGWISRKAATDQATVSDVPFEAAMFIITLLVLFIIHYCQS